ncbi:MAG TPA: hypothetical protein VGM03_19680 [Phycisphaerae bacterium]|jgi:hypothetical protein
MDTATLITAAVNRKFGRIVDSERAGNYIAGIGEVIPMILKPNKLAVTSMQRQIRRGGFDPRTVNDGGLVFS